MSKKVISFRVEDTYEDTFNKLMKHENERREKVLERKLNRAEFLEYMSIYFKDNVVDKINIKRKERLEAQFYANITKKLVEKYFNFILDSLEGILEKMADQELYIRLMSYKNDIAYMASNIDPNDLLQRLERDDKKMNQIREKYFKLRSELIISPADIAEESEDDERHLF